MCEGGWWWQEAPLTSSYARPSGHQHPDGPSLATGQGTPGDTGCQGPWAGNPPPLTCCDLDPSPLRVLSEEIM